MQKRNIGTNLGILRRKSGITQAQLAEETGVTANHISHVENGTNAMSITLLLDACKVLDVTPNDILAGEYSETFQDEELRDKVISLKDVSPNDRIILDYMYQFMKKRN